MPGAQTAARPDVSVVILTMGNRSAALASAISSALDQTGVRVEAVIVGNGVPAADLHLPTDPRVIAVEIAENIGVPGGRNHGAQRASAPFLAFLDDDARFIDQGVLARCAESFRSEPSLGVIALRIIDENGRTSRRHVPRVGSRHPERSGSVTAFLGGAAAIRRAAFTEVEGFADAFVYAMEESDLALRLIDHGWSIRYDGTPAVFHPATEPGRHHGAAERTMRNRVWLAHRTLPAVVAALYIVDWYVISTVRQPRLALRLVRTIADAWRTRPGGRSPIRWRTVARLTRLGRPPLI